jgi:hypothetical protein
MKQQYLEAGKIVNTFGIRGEVKLQPWCDSAEFLKGFKTFYIDSRPRKVASARVHKDMLILRFEDVEKMLGQWADAGVTTGEAARAYVDALQRKAEAVAALLEAAGSDRRPRMEDLTLYDGWLAKFDPALIDYAAACVKGQYPPLEKMDALLSEWQAVGASTVEAARSHWQKRRRPAGQGASVPANPALDYSQREYKDEDFGEDFYYDVMKKHKEGGDQA